MRFFQRHIPSMFHRRLSLLLLGFCCGFAVLWTQLARLTVVQGSTLRLEAEKALVTYESLPTIRGRILDRKGRELAVDNACFDVQVDYRVITGQWAYDQARLVAIKDLRQSRQSWVELGFEGREALIDQYRPTYDQQLEALWRTLARVGQIERAELEKRKADIVERVQSLRAHTWGRWRDLRAERMGKPVTLDEVSAPIAEEQEPHTLLPALPDDAAYELLAAVENAQWPGLHIERSKVREYPNRNWQVELDASTLPSPLRPPPEQSPVFTIDVREVGANIIGTMREAWSEDTARRPYVTADGKIDRGGYRKGDRVGSNGVEAAEEDRLRGSRGLLTSHRDTGQVEREPAAAGNDVHLTVDVALQARVMAIMDPRYNLMRVQEWHLNKDTPKGTDLYGAAIVMEVDSGEVLAMVSTPAAPPRIDGQPYPDLRLDPNFPLLNKPLERVYEPGSTLKPIVYAIAASQRAVEWDQHVVCDGHFLDSRNDILRCWIYREEYGYRSHGPLDPVAAIAQSCNEFFYTCGNRLGPVRLVRGLRGWGFGEGRIPGMPATINGLLPDVSDPATLKRLDDEHVDAMIGIGQGEISVPPIQIAAAHAALARGGYYLTPLLVRDRAEEQIDRELSVPPQVMRNTIRGMYESVANPDSGTASTLRIDGQKEPIINIEGVTVRAKTGTAQTPPQYPLVITRNAKGEERIVEDKSRPALRDGTHSWYVAHVQKPGEERAAYVVLVMVEYGGSGGKVAGPVTNQILHALRAEGYL